MSHPSEWIGRFLKRYVDTIGPHDFPTDADDEDLEPGQPTAAESFMRGWVYAFTIPSPPVTEAEADAATVRLALHPPAFRRQHLPAVVEVVLKMRERDATQKLVEAVATPPEEARAIVRSKGCPECSTANGPTGFALRRGMWKDASWHATASLYCRCSVGRYRLEREEAYPPPFDDLQALPHLWDWKLSHPTWTDRPAPPPSVEGRQWVYLAPGESAPPVIAKAAKLGAPAKGRRPDWAAPIPKDLPMPRPVPRLAPEPEPPPPPCPKDEHGFDEESLKWL